jgi:hypothetical protein
VKPTLQLTQSEYKRVAENAPSEVLLRVNVCGKTMEGMILVEGEQLDLDTLKLVRDKRSPND